MKRTNFYEEKRRLSYQIAGVLIIIATLGFTIMYFYQKNIQEKQQLALEEKQKETQEASYEVQPKEDQRQTAFVKEENIVKEKEIKEDTAKQVIEQVAEASQLNLHFQNQISWPVEGKVLLNYSMDQTVYFPTLKQYQYNPALIISSKVNDKVCSVSEGKIVSILTDAKTGTTLTMDLGDGYQAVYGQLKEIPVATGEYVAKGQCIGYVSEPSKYYLEEGANLYFQILKDGNPLNPQDFLEP